METHSLLHGTLDALVLKTLGRGPLHGCAVARWIEERSKDTLQIEEGTPRGATRGVTAP